MAEESSMQINLTTTTYTSEEKPKKRKVVVSEDDSAEIAKSPEKKKSRRIQNGNEQLNGMLRHSLATLEGEHEFLDFSRALLPLGGSSFFFSVGSSSLFVSLAVNML